MGVNRHKLGTTGTAQPTHHCSVSISAGLKILGLRHGQVPAVWLSCESPVLCGLQLWSGDGGGGGGGGGNGCEHD